MRRPRVWHVMLAIVFGALTNLFVAWVVPLLLSESASVVEVAAGEPMREMVWPMEVPSTWPSGPEIVVHETAWCFEKIGAARDGPNHVGVSDFRYRGQTSQAGWPLRAFRGGSIIERSDSIRYRVAGLFSVSAWAFFRPDMPLTTNACTLPIWSGLLVNTGFFAVMAWGGWLAIDVGRRHSRMRRGLCPACAYEIRGLAVCPECGGVGSTAAH